MIRRLLGSRLGRSSGFVLGAELGLQATRAVTTIVLFRVFGAAQFGAFAGVLALTTLASSSSQIGMNHVSVRAVARGNPIEVTWAKLVTTIAAGGLVASVVVVLIAGRLIDMEAATVARVAVAQLIGAGGTAAATMLSEASQRADVGFRLNTVGMVTRLGALLIFVGGWDDVDSWSWFLLAAAFLSAAFAIAEMVRVFDAKPSVATPSTDELRLGVNFVVLQTASSVQTNVDRVVLNGYGLSVDAGLYAPAYRIAQLCLVPLMALVRASYADFFKLGAVGARSAVAHARRLTGIAAGLGVAAAAGLWFLAPMAEILTGDARVSEIIRWLAPFPLLRGLQYFPGNVLSGLDRNGVRNAINIGSAALNLVLNLLLVPSGGWRAAVAATLVAEACLAMGMWLAALGYARREARAEVESDRVEGQKG